MLPIIFSSDFSAFSISTSAPGEATLKITDLESGQDIFRNTYYIPEINSALSALKIHGIPRILELDMQHRQTFHRSYSFSVSSEEDISPVISHPYGEPAAAQLQADIIHCSRKMTQQASQWLQSNLLVDQTEFELPVNSGLLAMTYHTTGLQNPGLGMTSYPGGQAQSPVPASSGWNTLQVPPSQGRILTIVSMGETQYIIRHTLDIQTARCAIFSFRNSFNLPEPICLEGTMTLSAETESQTAYVDGRLRRFDISRADSYTFTAGGITASRAREISRILLSTEATLAAPGSHIIPEAAAPVPVIIESVDGDISDSPESLNSVKIKFRLADSIL